MVYRPRVPVTRGVYTRGKKNHAAALNDMVLNLDPRHNPEFPSFLPDYLRDISRAPVPDRIAPVLDRTRDYILRAKQSLTVIRHRLTIWVRDTWLPHWYRPGGARYRAARAHFQLLSQQRRATRRDTQLHNLRLQG